MGVTKHWTRHRNQAALRKSDEAALAEVEKPDSLRLIEKFITALKKRVKVEIHLVVLLKTVEAILNCQIDDVREELKKTSESTVRATEELCHEPDFQPLPAVMQTRAAELTGNENEIITRCGRLKGEIKQLLG